MRYITTVKNPQILREILASEKEAYNCIPVIVYGALQFKVVLWRLKYISTKTIKKYYQYFKIAIMTEF